jgi:ketosteroid isomerase-like protein
MKSLTKAWPGGSCGPYAASLSRDTARAMSEENVERAHRAFDAFNRRDLDAFLDLMDPEVETVTDLASVEGRPYRGHDGVRDWWRDLFAVFPDFHIEILEARDRGHFVIAHARRHGHGLDSGAPVEETVWQASEWRHGRVLWWQIFASEAEALEAAGLSE